MPYPVVKLRSTAGTCSKERDPAPGKEVVEEITHRLRNNNANVEDRPGQSESFQNLEHRPRFCVIGAVLKQQHCLFRNIHREADIRFEFFGDDPVSIGERENFLLSWVTTKSTARLQRLQTPSKTTMFFVVMVKV